MQSALATSIAPVGEPPSPFDVQLVLDEVSRSFGKSVVLSGVDLQLRRGAICRVVGNSGSGKSTLLRVAAGTLKPSSGRRWAAGPALYLHAGGGARHTQTVRQTIEFVAGRRSDSSTVNDALGTAGLLKLADTPAGQLSTGARAQVSLAVALVCRPSVVCLDEHAVHLDAVGRAAATRVVTTLAAHGSTVLVATDDEGFLAGVADKSVRLAQGRAHSDSEVVASESATRRRTRRSSLVAPRNPWTRHQVVPLFSA